MKKNALSIFLLFLLAFLGYAQVSAPSLDDGGVVQPMVALFETNSFVPSLPLQAFQACDRSLALAILGRNCCLRGQAEAAQALQRRDVVRLVELTAPQAKALMEELHCVALVQMTITEYRLQSASRQGNRPQKNLPRSLNIATIGGEIQIWSQGDTEVKCLKFRKVLTDQDPNLACVPGEHDKNGFGIIALRYALEQAMQEFSK